MPPLRPALLQRCVEHAAPPQPLEVDCVADIASTNAALLARARQQAPRIAQLLAADHQRAGRGRQGRSWQARPRQALLFSLAVPLGQRPAGLPAIAPACGVALADVLHARGVVVQLKWPNDLLLDGRKLGGILCELATDAAGRATLVVGVGLNVRLSGEDRAAVGQPAAALSDALPGGLPAEREAWIAALAVALLDAVAAFARHGFEPWRARYNALLQGRGRVVDIVDAGIRVAGGRLVEADAQGRLVLDDGGERTAISVGDVSMRFSAPEAGR